MYRALAEKRKRIRELREKRDVIEKEKSDQYAKAMALNDKIDPIQKELDAMDKIRAEYAGEIEKLMAKRSEVMDKIKGLRAEIDKIEATKNEMLSVCKQKKSEIAGHNEDILKLQGEISWIKGKNRSW